MKKAVKDRSGIKFKYNELNFKFRQRDGILFDA